MIISGDNKVLNAFTAIAIATITLLTAYSHSDSALHTHHKTLSHNKTPSHIMVTSTHTAFVGRNINPNHKAPLINLVHGALQYGLYASRNQSIATNALPDFSHAGYMGGGIAVPSYTSIPIREILKPMDGDDLPQIQNAIARVAKQEPDSRGIRGAILLTAGHYQISDTLVIDTSGIVLRGEGQGKHGTRIIATTTHPDERESVIELKNRKQKPARTKSKLLLATHRKQSKITDNYVPVGATSIHIDSTDDYHVGDEISIVRTPNATWVGKNGVNTAHFGWDPLTYAIAFTRKVTAIKGKTLIMNIPLVDAIDAQFGGGYVERINNTPRVQQMGVENLSVQTLYRNKVTDLNRAFFGITLAGVENSWLRDLTVVFASHGYNITDGSRFNTAQDVAYLDPNFDVRGGRNYGFIIHNGEMNLFQRCYGRKGRHTFVTGSRVSGPNVYLDCTSIEADNDSGPHHRWATGTLYDNTQGYQLHVQNRKNSGTGHGWAGAQNMFWNTDHATNIVEAPPHAMNWAFGIRGKLNNGKWVNEPNGLIKSLGKPVVPRSLYLQQLQDRLGPEAVNNITIEAQRRGEIWTLLKQWRGEYRLSDRL